MELNGILPAILTPLDNNGKLNTAAYEQLLERVYSAGVHGIYVAGQTGEGVLLPMDERKRLTEISLRHSPKGAQVIVHIGSYRTEDAVDLAKHASKLGVTAVSSLPALGLFSFAEIKTYYQTVVTASEVPFLVYFFPALAPPIQTVEHLQELCEIPNVAGMKFTDYNLYRLERVKRFCSVLYNGHDEVLAAGLLMGADGGIGTFYNLIPEMFLDVYNRVKANDGAGAMKVQTRINELIEIVLRFPALSAVKRMMTWSGVPCGDVVAPRRSMNAEEEARLIEALAASTFRDAPFARP